MVDESGNPSDKYSESNCPIYSGCYANIKVSFWFQSNNFGKRVNCQLVAIQFAKHGESFGGGNVNPVVAADGFGEVNIDNSFPEVPEDIPF